MRSRFQFAPQAAILRTQCLRFISFVIGAGFLIAGAGSRAQEGQHLAITQPGGMPGLPVITGIEPVTNGLRITWDGPPGYYQLLQKLGVKDSTWQAVGGRTNLAKAAVVTALYSNAFFRVSGPAPKYAGSQACMECHENIHTTEMDTRHSRALETLKAVNQQNNASCLPCHTVGHGLPTGFINESATPHLAGVQCENCHGPAGNHAANPDDLVARPRVDIAAQVCGGCHTGAHHPTFDEWKTTGHFQVVEDMSPANRIASCGRCHSGSSRLSQMQNKPLPVNDANVGLVCVTCHDPHRRNVHTNALAGTFTFTNLVTGKAIVITNNELGAVYTNQVRNPVSSLADYFLTTSDVFTNKYDPNINVCAQCHNHRGATWSSSSRPPHHSVQYNMLIGTVGELATGLPPRLPSTHSQLEKQCASCHMQKKEFVSGDEPAESGHKFEATSYESCAKCHKDAATAKGLVELAKIGTPYRVQTVKAWLDMWALVKAPDALRTKYGTRAWEFTTPGSLSPGGSGPTSAEQAQIPTNIKKARFNLYLVLYDGSSGVHNGPYAGTLLDTAVTWIQQELSK